MEIYGLKQKKKRKLWLIPLLVLAAVLLSIYVVGVITNITGAEHDTVTAAVRENAELKRQIEDLNTRIASLEEQLSGARSELDLRPTIAPAPAPTVAAEGQSVGTSPRNYSE